MSQIYKDRATGPVPPTVVAQITTDVRDNTTTGPGTVIPSSNNVNILGRDTIQNNDNGIRTDADANNSSNCYVELTNRISVNLQTVGAVVQTATIMTPTNATSLTFNLTLTAYASTGDVALGGQQIGLVRKSGGAVTVIGTNDTFDEYDAALGANDWEITNSGADLIISVTGVAGFTLNWQAVFTYVQVS